MKTPKQILEEQLIKWVEDETKTDLLDLIKMVNKEWLQQEKNENQKILDELKYPKLLGGKIYLEGKIAQIDELLEKLEEK